MPGPNDDIRAVTRRVGGRLLQRPIRDEILQPIDGPIDIGPIEIGPSFLTPFPVTALRTADLLLVRFSFQNLRFAQGGLRRRLTNQPAYLIADFPPQHLVEQAFPEKGNPGTRPTKIELPGGKTPPPDVPPDNDVTPPAPPVWASLSAHSRLVFKVTTETIGWSLDGLLTAMSTLPLNIAPHAANPRRVFTPFDVLVVDKVATKGVQRRLLARQAVSVPATVRSVFRASAATKVLDYRLGRGASASIGAASNLATELNLNPRLDAPLFTTLPPEPRAPLETETAIEIPWRMQLSPHADGAFAHADQPVEHGGRVELWHSRLGQRATAEDGSPIVDEDDATHRTVRAIWTRDMQAGPLAPAVPDAMGGTDVPNFTKSLTTRDRRMLVNETSNFRLTRSNARWTPPAVDVDRLMLTTLGGWLRSDLDAPTLPDGDFSITEWKHRATMGRDHEVKVVYAGFLFPFGHRASLVKVTERKLQLRQGSSGRIAYLRQRFFIIVREQTLTYPVPAAGLPVWNDTGRTYVPAKDRGPKQLGLALPMSSISVLTRVTPDLDTPVQKLTGPFCFIPYVDGAPFEFKVLVTDRESQIAEYGGPLMFVERGHNETAAKLGKVTEAYWNLPAGERQHRLRGQRLAFAAAKAPDGSQLDTTLATDVLEFDAAVTKPMTDRSQDEARFWPVLRSMGLVVPAMNALAGAANVTTMQFPLAYLTNGYTGNQTHVFLEVAGQPAALSFTGQGDRSGGFVTPNLAVTGLSGSKGPVGGSLTEAMSGSMNPASFFGGLDAAKLFGAVKLSDLLGAIGLTPANMPSFVADSVNQVTAFLNDAQRIIALANDVQSRFAAEADAAVQAVRTALQTVKARAAAVLAAFADVTSLGGAVALMDQLAGELTGLADALDAATLLPAALRADATGVVRRLAEHLEAAGDVVAAAQQLLGGLTLPETVNARLSWSTELAPWPAGAALFQPRPKGGQSNAQARSTLDLAVEVQAPTKPGKDPTATIVCSITPFSLRLLGDDPFIQLVVDVLEFTLRPGKKPDVNIVLADPGVVFGGPLSFVNTLQELIPFDGFSDPPYLDIDAQGIRAGFDLALPDIAIGVFSICNISLGAEARVPFIGDSLDFTFNFCTRENPFRLTVWVFGGGGFFAVTVTPDRCRMLEASFEFGAAAALDFGVASGSIECMAGIYFRLETSDDGQDDGELTGYFRLRGEVDVLGLISASIELYLELSYEPPSGKATGKATLTIEVEVFFLSFSVEISCEKKFKGSNQDPTFEQVMGLTPVGGPRPWDEYCDAFAAI